MDRPAKSAPPNAAPKAQVDDVFRRIDALGIDWKVAVEKAEIGIATGYRLKKYTASVGSLKRLEDWLLKAEKAEFAQPAGVASEKFTTRLGEWMALGKELCDVDPEQFDQMLDGLRDLVKFERMREGALLKIFRANPDRRR